MLDDLFEILLQIVLDGGTEVIEQHKLSKKARIVICALITLIFSVFIAFLIWVFITNNNILLRVIDVGVIIFLVAYLISLWRKIVLSKR